MTQWHCKRFDALTLRELYEILRVRAAVFVAEQACAYQDLDGRDLSATHLFCERNGEILAYLRLCEKPDEPETLHMGRVLTAERGTGLGAELLRRGIEAARQAGVEELYLEAQTYAEGFYAREGFAAYGEPFLEDGIPHVRMRKRLE